MGLYEFLFPNMAAAEHLRSMLEVQKQRLRVERRAKKSPSALPANEELAELQASVQRLRGDLGYLTLVLGGIVEELNRSGTLTREQLQATMKRFDVLDQLEDGSLDIEALKSLTERPEDRA